LNITTPLMYNLWDVDVFRAKRDLFKVSQFLLIILRVGQEAFWPVNHFIAYLWIDIISSEAISVEMLPDECRHEKTKGDDEKQSVSVVASGWVCDFVH
jgi:hypothetical protein